MGMERIRIIFKHIYYSNETTNDTLQAILLPSKRESSVILKHVMHRIVLPNQHSDYGYLQHAPKSHIDFLTC